MSVLKQCPECNSSDLRTSNAITARGAYGPDLLPGTSGVFVSSKMRVVVCLGCGLMRHYATKEALTKIASDDSRQWSRLI